MEHLLKQVGVAMSGYSLKETPAFNGAIISDLARAKDSVGMFDYIGEIERVPTNTGVCR